MCLDYWAMIGVLVEISGVFVKSLLLWLETIRDRMIRETALCSSILHHENTT